MRISPRSPRRQRKALYTADSFERRRRMTVLLSRELRRRFHRRSLPLRKGDTVRVLSGSFVGREERVARVDRRDYSVTLDNVTLKAADEKLKPLALRPGHLVITRLNLSDAWRRRALKVSEEEVTPEERGVVPEAEEETPAEPAGAPETPVAKTEGEAAGADTESPSTGAPTSEEKPEAEETPKPRRPRKKAAKAAPAPDPEEDA